jgi:hypothetical protein
MQQLWLHSEARQVCDTAAPTAAPVASSKVIKYKQVYYEARLELKGDNMYTAYVKQLGLLFKNILLVH